MLIVNRFPPAIFHRWARGAASALLLVACLTHTEAAAACGGPCAVPRFYGLSLVQERVVVTSNFGLLYEEDSNWNLVCEESIGGLLLSAMQARSGHFVNTGDGLFSNQDDNVCQFVPQIVTEAEDYLLDYTVAEGANDTHVALIQDQQSSELQVWSRTGDEAFTLVHSLGVQSGHRRIAAAGELEAIYALGYVSSPRRFALTYRVGDEDWQEYVDDEPGRSLSIAGIDPTAPEWLYLWLETPSTEPSRLVRFDTAGGEPAEVFEFAGTESFAGFTVSTSHVYVAGRSDSASSLYAAERGSSQFERVQQDLPPLDCLLAEGERLFACGADFSRSSQFLVAMSDDGGASWQPRMRLSDLGTVSSCGAPCQQTTSWLYSTFAPTAFTDGGTPPAGGGQEPQAPDPNPKTDSGGCQLVTTASGQFGAPWLLLGLSLWARRSRRRGGRRLMRQPGPTIL